MEFSESVSNGYRVLRSGNNIIYTGKICKEGAAEFQQRTYDAIAELKKRERDEKMVAAKRRNNNNNNSQHLNGISPGPPGGGNGQLLPIQQPQQQPAPAQPAPPPVPIVVHPQPGENPDKKASRSSVDPEDPAVIDHKNLNKNQKVENITSSSDICETYSNTSYSSNLVNTSLSDSNSIHCNDTINEFQSCATGLCDPEYLYNSEISANIGIQLGGPNPPPSQKENSDSQKTSSGAASSSSSSSSELPTALNTIRFHFTSAGGNLPAGIAMMDMVEEAGRMGYHTECFNKGFVGSAATFPAFACKQRFSTNHCLFLLHPPAKSGVHGQTEELQIHSNNLDLWHNTSEKIYQRLKRFTNPIFGSSSGSQLQKEAGPTITKTFNDNRYNTADDVLKMGLVDHLIS